MDSIWNLPIFTDPIMDKQRAPSFTGLLSQSESQSRAKRANRARDTKPELLLRRELHKLGLRYRIDVRELAGRPDVVFPPARIAVFCDGDFWHGRDWPRLREQLASRANAGYWTSKIEYNRRRDEEVSGRLRAECWTVLRFWESEIRRDPAGCAVRVKSLVDSRRH